MTNELNYLREIDITLLLTISNSQLEIQLIETIEGIESKSNKINVEISGDNRFATFERIIINFKVFHFYSLRIEEQTKQ